MNGCIEPISTVVNLAVAVFTITMGKVTKFLLVGLKTRCEYHEEKVYHSRLLPQDIH